MMTPTRKRRIQRSTNLVFLPGKPPSCCLMSINSSPKASHFGCLREWEKTMDFPGRSDLQESDGLKISSLSTCRQDQWRRCSEVCPYWWTPLPVVGDTLGQCLGGGMFLPCGFLKSLKLVESEQFLWPLKKSCYKNHWHMLWGCPPSQS